MYIYIGWVDRGGWGCHSGGEESSSKEVRYYIYIYIQMCTYVYTNVYKYAYMYIYVYTNIYMDVNKQSYVYIYKRSQVLFVW
jgi:hypothetical protein